STQPLRRPGPPCRDRPLAAASALAAAARRADRRARHRLARERHQHRALAGRERRPRRAVGDALVRRGSAHRSRRAAAQGARAVQWIGARPASQDGYAVGQRRIPQIDQYRHHGARRMTAVTTTAPRQMSVTTSISDRAWGSEPPRLGLRAYITCFKGIVWREVLRYLHQRERFMSALVRPLIWLFIFAAGFRQTLGVSIIPPYQTYVLYEEFIAPGLIAMILLFNAMQSSLSMVYDRETGTMRTLLVSPFPRSFLLLSKLLGGVSVALMQAFAFVFVAYFWGIQPPPITQVKLFT